MGDAMPNGQRTTASRLADLVTYLRRPKTLPQIQAATGLSKRRVCELLQAGREQGVIVSEREDEKVWHRGFPPAPETHA